jgi:hypothetical protein
MTTTPLLTGSNNSHAAPSVAAQSHWQRPNRAHTSQSDTHRSRFNPTTIGFWLGGLLGGAAGCAYAASLPYRYPVGVTVGELWWAIYLGCLGASLGALLGMFVPGASKPHRGRPASSTEAVIVDASANSALTARGVGDD